jgi:hypothetical protein
LFKSFKYVLNPKAAIQAEPNIARQAPKGTTYSGAYSERQIYVPGILPMFPIALIMPIAAALFAGVRGMVLELQARTKNPLAYPASLCQYSGGRRSVRMCLLVMRNIAKYRGPTTLVAIEMMYPIMQAAAGHTKWKKRSPVRSACHALGSETTTAHIHGGAVSRRVSVVL